MTTVLVSPACLFRHSRDQLPQPLGPGLQSAVQAGLKQIQIERIGKLALQPSGLPCASRSEDEAAMFGHPEEST